MMARRRFTRAPLGYSAGTRAHTSIRRAYTPSPRRSYLDHDDAYVSRPTPHFYDPSPEYLMADNLASRTIENTTYAAYDADDLYKRSRGKDRQLLSNINYAVPMPRASSYDLLDREPYRKPARSTSARPDLPSLPPLPPILATSLEDYRRTHLVNQHPSVSPPRSTSRLRSILNADYVPNKLNQRSSGSRRLWLADNLTSRPEVSRHKAENSDLGSIYDSPTYVHDDIYQYHRDRSPFAIYSYTNDENKDPDSGLVSYVLSEPLNSQRKPLTQSSVKRYKKGKKRSRRKRMIRRALRGSYLSSDSDSSLDNSGISSDEESPADLHINDTSLALIPSQVNQPDFIPYEPHVPYPTTATFTDAVRTNSLQVPDLVKTIYIPDIIKGKRGALANDIMFSNIVATVRRNALGYFPDAYSHVTPISDVTPSLDLSIGAPVNYHTPPSSTAVVPYTTRLESYPYDAITSSVYYRPRYPVTSSPYYLDTGPSVLQDLPSLYPRPRVADVTPERMESIALVRSSPSPADRLAKIERDTSSRSRYLAMNSAYPALAPMSAHDRFYMNFLDQRKQNRDETVNRIEDDSYRYQFRASDAQALVPVSSNYTRAESYDVNANKRGKDSYRLPSQSRTAVVPYQAPISESKKYADWMKRISTLGDDNGSVTVLDRIKMKANATPGVTSARASVSRRAVRVSTPAPALQSSPSTVLSQTLDRSEVSRPRASVPYMYSRRVVAPIFDVAPVNDSTALLPYYSSPLLRRAVGARAQAGLKRDIRAQSAAPSFAHSPVTAAELSPYYNLGGAVAKLPTEGLRASRKPLPSSMYTYAPRSYLGPSRPIAWDMEPSRTRSPSQMYVRYMSPVRHAISIDHPLKTRASIPYAKATHPGKYNYPSASYIVQKARKGVMAPPEDYSAAGIRHEIGLSGRHVYTVPYTSVYGEKMRSLPRQRAAATRAKSEAKAYSPLEAMMYRPSYSLRKSRRGPRYAVIDYSSGNAEAAVIAPHVEINRRHKEPRSRFAQDKIRSIRLEPKDDYGTPAPERFTGGLHSSAATPLRASEMKAYRNEEGYSQPKNLLSWQYRLEAMSSPDDIIYVPSSLYKLKDRVGDIRIRMDKHRQMIDRYLEPDLATSDGDMKSRILSRSAAYEARNPTIRLEKRREYIPSQRAKSVPFRIKIPSGQHSSSVPPQKPVSNLRKRLRGVLCKTKNDPAYFN